MLIPRATVVCCHLCGKQDSQDYFVLTDTTGTGEQIHWKCDPPCQKDDDIRQWIAVNEHSRYALAA